MARQAVQIEVPLPLVRPFSAVPELLHRVHDAGIKVAVASSANKSELEVYRHIACIKDLVYGGRPLRQVCRLSKPAPASFRLH